MFNHPSVPESVLKRLCELDISRDSKMLSLLGLTDERLVALLQVLDGGRDVNYFDKLDMQLYVWNTLFPDLESDSFIFEHCYSKGGGREYDPVKNGKNIIKHGISFGEVTSYSKRFGTLIVPCPDKKDGTRHVIFSDLEPGTDGKNLCFPISNSIQEPVVYTLSIVTNRDQNLRFISSIIMSRKKFAKAMKTAFKGIYDDDPIKKKKFVSECVLILKRDLFKYKA